MRQPIKDTSSSGFRHILILADIEGSSGCGSYRASSFLTHPWARACKGMSLDVDAVVKALFDAGVEIVTIKDFHRTAYNLLPELIDPRAHIVCGYLQSPVPGLGDPGDAEAVMMLGMHPASGTPGFLPHTFTSRLASIKCNGRPLAEVELFASSLAPFGIRPIFFSGCVDACAQARRRIPGIQTAAIDKRIAPEALDAAAWRRKLAKGAVAALTKPAPPPYRPQGPLRTVIRIRDGVKAAARMADRWGFKRRGAAIVIDAQDIHALYDKLTRLCFLSPMAQKALPFSLWLFNSMGRFGRWWVRRQLRHPADN